MDRLRTLRVSLPLVVALLAVGTMVSVVVDAPLWAVVVAVLAGWLMLRIGFAMLSGLATPVPPPPPPGELRTVKILYRCSICGTEVRMTSANDEVPEAPRHCQEEMDLVAPVE